jgi:hypothetical protein
MEGDYKKHVRSGNWLGLLGEIIGGGREGEKNPLMRGMEGKNKKDGFEAMNRDSGEFLPPSQLSKSLPLIRNLNS